MLMLFRSKSRFVLPAFAVLVLAVVPVFRGIPAAGEPQASSSSSPAQQGPTFAQEKAPSLVDPAGPAIELIPSEPLFFMAAVLNQCGYDEGLAESDPMRQTVRDQVAKAL